jgi:hypothetical protein
MLKELLQHRKKEILEKWLSEALKSYPDDAARFMENEANRFANPVGHTFRQEFEAIYNLLLEENSNGDITTALKRSVKIWAVQDLTPSQAIAFIFCLKKAIREELAEKTGEVLTELLTFESRIDSVALHLFDRYMADRERLYNIRLNETRRSIARTMEKFGASIVVEQPNKLRGSQNDKE